MIAKISNIEQQIEQLKGWERGQMVAEWERLYGRVVPRQISKVLMIRAIAYKWQEQEFGGLSASNQKLLDRMAEAFMQDPSALKPSLQIKTGTRLRRLWQGKLYEVTATADGFIHEGNKYRSLSEVARVITGTRWNGLVFFGLKQNVRGADE